jgi:hypothetical protein
MDGKAGREVSDGASERRMDEFPAKAGRSTKLGEMLD